MLEKSKTDGQSSLFFSLESTLNHKHPLFILVHKVDWDMFEKAFSPLYCPGNGRPVKPIWLMVGLLILKHVRNLSDESVVEQWSENIYYQFFVVSRIFCPQNPVRHRSWFISATELGRKGLS